MLLVFPIVALVVRDRPQSMGLEPFGATEPVPVPERSPHPFRPAIDGLTLGLRSRTFWFLSGTFFVCGLSTNGVIGTHFIPAAIDHNLTAVTGASLLALMGLFDVIGTTCSGWLTDRVDPRYLLAWYYSLRGLAVIALPLAFGAGWALVLFAIFYGLDWVATVPPTVKLTADAFGKERVGIVFGWVFAAHQIGAASAAWAAGASRQWTGTYNYAFVGAGVAVPARRGPVAADRPLGARPRTRPGTAARLSETAAADRQAPPERPSLRASRGVTTVKGSDPVLRCEVAQPCAPPAAAVDKSVDGAGKRAARRERSPLRPTGPKRTVRRRTVAQIRTARNAIVVYGSSNGCGRPAVTASAAATMLPPRRLVGCEVLRPAPDEVDERGRRVLDAEAELRPLPGRERRAEVALW